MDFEPVSVALKFAFLGVLYLFLVWIVRSARRDLKMTGAAATAEPPRAGAPSYDAWLVVERSDVLDPGSRFDLFGGATMGRSADADISFGDRYASGLHARVFSRGDRYFVEDMNSTNGTVLNGVPVHGESEIADGSVISIGDTSFRFELESR